MEIEPESSFAPMQWGRGIEGEGVFERKQPPPHPLPLSPDSGGEGNNWVPSEPADRIIAVARSWIGTPYVHQASLKQAGCDCLGLLRGVWRELYGEEPEETPPYSLDWAEATGAETLYMALRRHAREIGFERLAPGDIALFRMSGSSRATASLHERGGRGPAKHCGIVASKYLTSPLWGGRRAEGEPGVGLSRKSPHPIRFASLNGPISPPRGGESFTLIHARQNKRVSEEPLSAFWRGKLAFAFRI